MTIPEPRPRRWRWRPRAVPAYVAPPVGAPVAPAPVADAPAAGLAPAAPRVAARAPGFVVRTVARLLVAAHFALPERRARRPGPRARR